MSFSGWKFPVFQCWNIHHYNLTLASLFVLVELLFWAFQSFYVICVCARNTMLSFWHACADTLSRSLATFFTQSFSPLIRFQSPVWWRFEIYIFFLFCSFCLFLTFCFASSCPNELSCFDPLTWVVNNKLLFYFVVTLVWLGMSSWFFDWYKDKWMLRCLNIILIFLRNGGQFLGEGRIYNIWGIQFQQRDLT